MKTVISIIIILLLAVTGSFSQTLDDYFEIAAENNPGLQANYKAFEAALQKVPQVNTLPDPTFSFGFFVSPVETKLGPQRAKLSLTQMFPWFGTLKARGDAATLLAEARYQTFLNDRNRLYYQLAANYFPLYELKKWRQIEQENIDILESYKTMATRKFENGYGTMVNVLRVDLMLKEAQTRLRILNDKEKPLLSSFNSLLNREAEEKVEVPDSLSVEYINPGISKDSLLALNPALAELDFKTKASAASEALAKKQGLPKLGIGLDYVVIGQSPGITANDQGKDALMPMVSVSIPLYRKRIKAAEREAQLMQESFSLQKTSVFNSLSSEYDRALFSLRQQGELIQLYDGQIYTIRQSLNLLLTAYGNSGNEFEEVLRMQQQLLAYRKSKATALAEFQIAQAKINFLMAKGIQKDENK